MREISFNPDRNHAKLPDSGKVDRPESEKIKTPESINFGKIRLQRTKPEDVKFLSELLSDKEHIRYTEFTDEDRTEAGCLSMINDWGEAFCFTIYNLETDQPIGFEYMYRAECPFKNDTVKAQAWQQANRETWESGRVLKKGIKGFGTDTKKAAVIFAFRHLQAEAYLGNCALGNPAPLKSLERAGLRPDMDFRGTDLDGKMKDGINEEGFIDQFGNRCREMRMKITREEFEELARQSFYTNE